jgi:hypothetical protein
MDAALRIKIAAFATPFVWAKIAVQPVKIETVQS